MRFIFLKLGRTYCLWLRFNLCPLMGLPPTQYLIMSCRSMPTFCTISLIDRPFFLSFITVSYVSCISFVYWFFIATLLTDQSIIIPVYKRSVVKVASAINFVWIIGSIPKCNFSHIYSYYQTPSSLSRGILSTLYWASHTTLFSNYYHLHKEQQWQLSWVCFHRASEI